MNYSIEFTRSAVNDSATAWLEAADRAALSQVCHSLEMELAENPHGRGESRASPLERVISDPPLGMWYDIVPDDMKVIVQSVWLIR